MPTLAEKASVLSIKRGELAAIFNKHKTDDPTTYDADIPIVEVNTRLDEIKTLQSDFDAARVLAESAQENDTALKTLGAPRRNFRFGEGGEADDKKEAGIKSVTRQFLESPGYKLWAGGGNRNSNGWGTEIAISMQSREAARENGVKALFSEAGTGYVPYPLQQPYTILSPQRRLVVADLIPQDDTDAAIIIYMEETAFINGAAATAEGALKPASGLGLTRRTVPMSKIATTLQVSDETMMDVPQIESYLRNRLGFMVQLEEERELLLGTGTLPELGGFLNRAGVSTQPQGPDDVFTAVYKAITKVNSTVGFAQASGIVMNPNNWVTFRTIKDAQGRFVLGDPGAMGADMLWGLPVVITPAEPAGTVLLGDFRTYSHIDRKLGLRLDVGFVNDDFARNLATIRAEERLALEIYRPSAFALVTGIA